MRDFWTGKRRYNKSVWYYDLFTCSNSSVSISCVLVAQAIKIQPDIGIDSMLSGLHNSNVFPLLYNKINDGFKCK